METKGIKTVIIVLLAAANIFFVFNITLLNLRMRNIPAEMIENAAAILRERRIYVDAGTISARRPVNYIYEGLHSYENYYEIAGSFSGASDEEVRIGVIRIPGVTAFNVGEFKFRFEEHMQVEIVRADYWDGDAGQQAELLAGHTGFSGSDENRAARIIRDFLRAYPRQDARTGFRIIGMKQDGTRDKVLINQTVGDILISSHTAFVIISGGEVKYFSGRWYFGPFVASHREPLLDSVNILFRSLEQDGETLAGARLESMEKQYTVMPYGGRFYLVPAWVLSFDDERRFSYDMITGNRNH